MLRYASGTIRGTALTPDSARRVMAHTAGAAAPWIITGLVAYLWRWAKTPHEWIDLGIGLPPRLPDHIRLQARLPQEAG